MQPLRYFIEDSPIVIVDDDRDARLLVYTLISKLIIPNRVEQFADTFSAWTYLNDVVHHTCPRLILSDINMPGQNGMAFCRELRGYARFDLTAVVLISGESTLDGAATLTSSGADALLFKYPDVQLLERSCVDALAKRARCAAAARRPANIG